MTASFFEKLILVLSDFPIGLFLTQFTAFDAGALAWVQSSILWQHFLSYVNILKIKRIKDTTSKI